MPVVLSSPHSGKVYPPDLIGALRIDPGELRCLDDGPVDSLVAPCVEAGAAVVAATYARAFVDLNRNSAEACDPDPPDRTDVAPGPAAQRQGPGGAAGSCRAGSPAARSTVAGSTSRRCRAGCIRGYQPYHDRLASLLGEARHRLGVAILLDCHSMPSEAAGQRAAAPVDVALGDRFGRSCGTAFMDVAAELLAARGLLVARNQPYAGGFITEHYGRPLEGWHALQVEFRRQLFMDESSGLAHAGAARLQALLMELVGVLAEVVSATAVSPAA